MACILCCGTNETYIPKQKALIERIKNSGLFEYKYLRKSKMGKAIPTKQLGCTKEGLMQAADTEKFIEVDKMSIRKFLDPTRDWD